jgi:hypothetical protein
MSTRARDLFFAVGTDESRRINWTIWHSVGPGSRVVVATLDRVLDAIVLSRPHAGRQFKLTMSKSASAGYFDRHPEEWYPGGDRDVDLDGAPARLVELQALAHEQLELFGG